ncbi:hypothetical protein COOONC_07032 [Cooperia oncophora]
MLSLRAIPNKVLGVICLLASICVFFRFAFIKNYTSVLSNLNKFMSTNHKDIGTLDLIFGLWCGMVGSALSMLIRMELSKPGLLLGNVYFTVNGKVFVVMMLMSMFIMGLILFKEKSRGMLYLSQALVFISILFFIPGNVLMLWLSD